MKIEILGPGCARCRALAAVTEAAARKVGLADEIVKVTDITKIIEHGVMVTPALVIDGTVAVAGKVPSEGEVTTILTTALARQRG
jgi:small redox-active disulfide protein 2